MRDSWQLRKIGVDDYPRLPRLDRPAGYLMLIQDVELSKRYRAFRTDRPEHQLAVLRESLPVKTEVMLTVQSNDIEATEVYFELLFEDTWKRDGWFALDESLVALIDRMVTLHGADAPHGKAIPIAAWSEYEVVPLPRSRLWCLPPMDYGEQPYVKSPAGYICVVRDARGNSYRLETTHAPKAFVAGLVRDEERALGIELIALLSTDDVRASEAFLFEKYGVECGDAWMEFDQYQLEALRDSVLRTGAYRSRYIFPD